MHRTDQRTPRWLTHLSFARFTFTKSTYLFLHFFASSRSFLNKIGMTWSVISRLSLLSCYIPFTMHLAGNLWNYFLSLSLKNKEICEPQNHRVLDLTSHPALDPCSIKLGRQPKWWHLDVLWRGIKIQGLAKSKNFCPNYSTKEALLF